MKLENNSAHISDHMDKSGEGSRNERCRVNLGSLRSQLLSPFPSELVILQQLADFRDLLFFTPEIKHFECVGERGKKAEGK